jgi:hypothetical protein
VDSRGPDPRPKPVIRVGVVTAPSLSDELPPDLIDTLRRELTARLPDITWQIELVHDGLVEPPASDSEIVGAAREALLTRGWDLMVVLTDLPLRVARRPVVAHASPVHGVAVLSVPALGTVGVRRRVHDALLRLIDALLGEAEDAGAGDRGAVARSRRMTHRLRQLASDMDEQSPSVRFTTRVLTGHLRLLAGMIRANRPWQLAIGLSRALTAAGAAGVFALVTSDIWRLADTLGWWRLTAVTTGSVGAICATLIIGAGLWERVRRPSMRQQVLLFNIATTGTVVTGVVVLYAALFVLALLAALLLIPPVLLMGALGHPVAFSDYVEVAWLASSVATVGGALGAGLETDEAVRRAAYTYRTSGATERAGA